MFKPSIALAALALLALPAAADEPSSEAPNAGTLFSQLDANQDGLLATDEIPEDRRSLFERLLRIGDKNDDGQLSGEEFAAALAGGHGPQAEPSSPEPEQPARPDAEGRRGPERLFERLDQNKDGTVELDEVPEQGRTRFQKLIERADKDGDGAITLREFIKAGPPSGEDGNPAKPGQGKRPPRDLDPDKLFKRMDQNGDGKVTADEVPEERREMLERMIERGDKDGDGALSLDELKAVFGRRQPPQTPGDDGPKREKGPAPQAACRPACSPRSTPITTGNSAALKSTARPKPFTNWTRTATAR